MKCFILYLFCAFFAAFDLAAAGVKNDNYLILLPLEVQRNSNSRLVSRPSVELEKEFEKAGLKGRIGFCDKTLTAENLRHYNVVVFGVAGYAFQRAIRGEEANRVAKLLLDYVRDGGGLLIMRNPGYQFDTEIAEINQTEPYLSGLVESVADHIGGDNIHSQALRREANASYGI